MASNQDCSIGFSTESTYKTSVTPARFLEYIDESIDWNKSVKQGKGLRVGSRAARSPRRVVTSAMGQGDLSFEVVSKGLGILIQALMGAGTSSLVSGSTFQQVFTFADIPPSLTLQKGLVEVGGTVDAYTFLGAMFDSFEINMPNDDIATIKGTVNAGDIATGTAYAAPSYVTAPNLFHFANLTVSVGTLTAPTATALASAATPLTNLRSASVSVNHNLAKRLNAVGTGRQVKPTVGLRDITGKLEVEYDSTTYRDLLLNDTPQCLVFTYTGGALSAGVETFQVVLPEVKFDNELAKTNGTDLITQSMTFAGLDNLTAAQPMWIVMRTSDAAL